MSISRSDVIKLVDLLKAFEKLCEERNIKFNKYSPDEIMEFLKLYRAYRGGKIDPPPF